MKAGLHVILRGKTHYYNRRIPLDLLEEYKPKSKILESLGTSDLVEANRLAAKRTAAIDEEFSRKRTLRAAPVVTELTPEQIASLVHNWGVAELEADDYSRESGYKDFIRWGMTDQESIEHFLPDYSEAYALGDMSLVKPRVDHLLKLQGIKLSPESAAYRTLSRSLLAKLIETWEIQLQRFAGKPVATPKAEPVTINKAAPALVGDSLEALVSYWKTQPARKGGDKSRTSLAEAETMLRKFRKMVGDVRPSKMTEEHIRRRVARRSRPPSRLGVYIGPPGRPQRSVGWRRMD